MIIFCATPRRRTTVAIFAGRGGWHMVRRPASRGRPIMAVNTGHTSRREVVKVRTGPRRRRGMALTAGRIGGDMVGRLAGAGCLAAALMTKYALTRRAFEYAIDMAGLAGSALMCPGQGESCNRVVKARLMLCVSLERRPQQKQREAEKHCRSEQTPRSSSTLEYLHNRTFPESSRQCHSI